MRRVFFISILIIIGIIMSSCSMLHTPEPIDYKVLEQTAAYEITLTAEAFPTSTDTPVPTETPLPTSTDTPVPTPTEEEMMLINRNDDMDEMIIHRDQPISSPTPLTPTATVYFPDKADFVAALPSPNQFVPNQHFYLTWQLKNAGTSTWSGKYRFHYSDGIHLADQDSYSISELVEPGGILTVTMPATAPGTEGTYKTTWILENPDGIPFYYVNFITIVGDQTFITEAPEFSATVTPSSLEWMCSDPNRSIIQGDGCQEYCMGSVVTQMTEKGLTCYVNGEPVY